MLNIVKHLIADMLNGYAKFAIRFFALAQDDEDDYVRDDVTTALSPHF